MASVVLSVGDLLPIRSVEVGPAVRPARTWTALKLRRAIADTVGSFLFLGILGWQVWSIASCVLQLGGSPAADPAADFMWPSSGAWPG